jgi:dCTP diphosphatase
MLSIENKCMSLQKDSLQKMNAQLLAFAQERDWKQFHTPKNLASALSVEAAELLEPFQWLPTGELHELDANTRAAVASEMADVLHYLVMLADRLNVDLIEASRQKILLNAEKYPINTSKGNANKYKENDD